MLFAAGCNSLPSRVPLDAKAGLYEKAVLSYRVDAGQLSIPLAVSRIEGQMVSYDEVPSAATPNRSTGLLLLTYPHPAERAGMVEAKVVIACAVDIKSNQPAGFREEWVLDIPKSELDTLYAQLRGLSFFSASPHPTPGIEITSTLNGKKVQKLWQTVPEFEALMQRVRRDGQLAAYERLSTPRSANPVASSVAAYRRLTIQDGGGDQRFSPGALFASRSGVETPGQSAARLAQSPGATTTK